MPFLFMDQVDYELAAARAAMHMQVKERMELGYF